MPQRSALLDISSHLHSARLATYLSDSHNDARAALDLYRWNLRIASAFQEVLSLAEIVLRNAIDGALRTWNAAQPKLGGGNHEEEWLLDPARPLNALIQSARRSASRNATNARAARASNHPRKHAPITHDDLLAQLTFGVYSKLLPTSDPGDKSYVARRVLWREALWQAFPVLPDDPDGVIVADRVRRLHALRNRVSHMEPLLEVNVSARHSDVLRLLATISPLTRDWCAGVSRVRTVERTDPRLEKHARWSTDPWVRRGG